MNTPPVGLFRKIIAGDPYRKTRLHDEKGNLVDGREWKYLPLVVQRCFARVVFGKLYSEPWWTFCVKRRVEAILTADMNVVEFGSGQSTLWLAQRAARVRSVENNLEWHTRVQRNIDRAGLSNVTLDLRTIEDYANVDDIPDRSVDFCVVDGAVRGRCVTAIIPKMKPGGWVYLDNSDKDAPDEEDGSNLRTAEATLRRHVKEDGIETFTGFTIGSLNTHQGTLFRFVPKT